MNKAIFWFTVTILAIIVFATSGCASSGTLSDLEGVPVADPDFAIILRNANYFPNVGVICFDGNAIITVTSDYPTPVIVENSAFCSPEVYR